MAKQNMPIVSLNVGPTPAGVVQGQALQNNMMAAVQSAVREQYEAEGAHFIELATTVKDTLQAHDRSLKANETEQGKISARLLEVEQNLARRATAIADGAGDSGGDTLGNRVVDGLRMDSAFQHLQGKNQGTARISLEGFGVRAALTHDSGTSSGGTYMPRTPDFGGIIAPVVAQPRLLQFLRSRQVASDSVRYIQLRTASGDVDVQAAEGDEKAELVFEGVPRRANIATIAGHTTASRQVLQDHVQLQGIIDTVLRQKLTNKLCSEIINGYGDDSDTDDEARIKGLLAQGVNLTFPQTSTLPDQVGETVVQMQELGFNPNLVVLNPTDWLMHVATVRAVADGQYLFGSPSAPIPPALWNRPCALEPALAQGTSMVLDTNYITVLDRESTSVMVSNTHKDFFTKNLVAILGELRAGLEVLDVGAVWIIEQASS